VGGGLAEADNAEGAEDPPQGLELVALEIGEAVVGLIAEQVEPAQHLTRSPTCW
jgi:hypothetical protein